jgi:hypothetical protein
MAPKSLSIQDLSSAVHRAVTTAKLKLPPEEGPFAYINPSIICGIWFERQIPEIQQIADSIAKQVSEHVGVTMAPVVQGGAAGEQAAGGTSPALRPKNVLCGFKPGPNLAVHF